MGLSREGERVGVDALLLTVPAYNKPPQEGLYRHFKTIADSVAIPGVLYNVPSRTAINMTADTTLRLAQQDNIVGVKEASSDADQITSIITNAPDGFRVWSGNDNETFSIMSTGGYGIVSVASNVIGNQIQSMINMILGGERERAAAELALYERFKADESAQAITGPFRRESPEDNNERQNIHEHRHNETS